MIVLVKNLGAQNVGSKRIFLSGLGRWRDYTKGYMYDAMLKRTKSDPRYIPAYYATIYFVASNIYG